MQRGSHHNSMERDTHAPAHAFETQQHLDTLLSEEQGDKKTTLMLPGTIWASFRRFRGASTLPWGCSRKTHHTLSIHCSLKKMNMEPGEPQKRLQWRKRFYSPYCRNMSAKPACDFKMWEPVLSQG